MPGKITVPIATDATLQQVNETLLALVQATNFRYQDAMDALEAKGRELEASLTASAEELLGGAQGSGGMPTIYCWGDSLTEGVGGWLATPENVQKAIVSAYPDVVSRTYGGNCPKHS